MATDLKKKTYLGQPIERVEDSVLLMGKAQFSDHLASLFYNKNFSKIILRNTGMLLTDMIPSVKRGLIRQAMGIGGRQPAMVREIQD